MFYKKLMNKYVIAYTHINNVHIKMNVEENDNNKVIIHIMKSNDTLELYTESNDLGEIIQNMIDDKDFDPNTILQMTQIHDGTDRTNTVTKTTILLIAVMLYAELKNKNSEVTTEVFDQIKCLLEKQPKSADPFFDPTGMKGFESPLLHTLMNDSLAYPRTVESSKLSDLMLKYVSDDVKKNNDVVSDLIKKHEFYKIIYPELQKIISELPKSNYVLKTEYLTDKSLLLFRLMFLIDSDTFDKIIKVYPYDINTDNVFNCLLTALCLANKYPNNDHYMKICAIFIKHPNIDLNKNQDGVGTTILHIATQLGIVDIVKVIVDTKRCDKNLTMRYGDHKLTALDIAKNLIQNEQIKKEMIEILK